MSDPSGKEVAGCLSTILALFVSLPIWYVMLFWVFYTLDAPPWLWASYWVYVPSGLFAGALREFSK